MTDTALVVVEKAQRLHDTNIHLYLDQQRITSNFNMAALTSIKASREVFTMPPYSTWNPCGIYVESMLFHMESAHSTWNMFWLRSHPF